MRRTLPGAVIPTYASGISGSATIISGVANVGLSLQEVMITSLGAAGTAVFSSNGVTIVTLGVSANSTERFGGIELPAGSGLDVFTSTPMDITSLHSVIDHTPGITKSAARLASYQASLLSPRATRVPNRFGGQVEG